MPFRGPGSKVPLFSFPVSHMLGNGNLLMHGIGSRNPVDTWLLLPIVPVLLKTGASSKGFCRNVCSGTGFWILFSSCWFVGTWLIYFVDSIAKSDDLFRMNHWTPFIWKQLWLLLTLSWVSDWERNVLVLLLTLGPLHSSLLCVMWSYAQE